MRITAHQPLYLPWLGFFDKISDADILVILDSVQFSRTDFIHRNKILINGNAHWLTIPIENSSSRAPIKDVRIEGSTWKMNHLESTRRNYIRAPHFDDLNQLLEGTLMQINSDFLIDYTMPLLSNIIDYLGIETKVILLSDLGIESNKSRLILDICNSMKADEYIAGSQGLNYLELETFESNRVKVLMQEYKHPVYRQNSDIFIDNLSVIDLISQEGQNSLSVIQQGRSYSSHGHSE
jgi:hypothetical protein